MLRASYGSKFNKSKRGVFRTQSNIYDSAFCKYIWRLEAVSYFRKNTSIIDAWLGSK